VGTETTVARKPEQKGTQSAPPVQASSREGDVADPLASGELNDPLQTWSGDAVQKTEEGGEGETEQRGEEGTAEGLQHYESALGKWLGPKLYKLIAPHLTLEKMSEYADQGFVAALTAGADQLNNLEGEVDEAAIKKFSEALEEQFAETAGEWLKGDGAEFAGKVAGWVDTHPGTIVTIALLAAAGAIAADMDIPKLSHKIGITDKLTAELGAKLGSLRNISLQAIEASLQYKSEAVKASYTAKWDEENDTHEHTLEGSATGENNTFTLKGNLKASGDDLEVFDLDASFQHFLLGASDRGNNKDGFSLGGNVKGGEGLDTVVSGRVGTTDGNEINTYSGAYNLDTGVFTLTDGYKLLTDSGAFSFDNSASTAGTGSQKVGYEGGLGAEGLSGNFSLENVVKSLGADSAYQLSDEQKLSVGLKYDRDFLKTSLDAVFSSEGASTLKGSTDLKLGGDFITGGSFDIQLNDPKLQEVGAYFGFKDSQEFTTFLGRYAYSGENDTHTVSLLMEKQLGSIYGRLEQKVAFTPEGIGSETTAQAAWFTDDSRDIGIIAGTSFERDPDGSTGFTPHVGMQIKGVPLTVGYDTKLKGWKVGLTIPFGR